MGMESFAGFLAFPHETTGHHVINRLLQSSHPEVSFLQTVPKPQDTSDEDTGSLLLEGWEAKGKEKEGGGHQKDLCQAPATSPLL